MKAAAGGGGLRAPDLQMLAGIRPERLLNPYVWPRFLERLAQARAD